jgi:hypothetical protein
MPDPCCTHSLPPGSPAHTTLRTRSHSGHQTIMATSSNASLRYSSIRFLRITNLPTSATNQPTASAPKNNCAWATHLAIARHISEHHTRPTYYVLTLTRQTFRPLFQQYGDMLHKLPGVTARHTSGCGVSTANSSFVLRTKSRQNKLTQILTTPCSVVMWSAYDSTFPSLKLTSRDRFEPTCPPVTEDKDPPRHSDDSDDMNWQLSTKERLIE